MAADPTVAPRSAPPPPGRPPPWDAPLPARWGRAQRLKNTLIYLAIRAAIAMVRLTPMRFALRMGSTLGSVASFIPLRERRRTRENLKAAFPESNERQRTKIMRGMFAHLGRSAMEAIFIRRLFEREPTLALTDEHREHFRRLLSQGRGAIAVSGHIGNWELLAQAVARAGFDIAGIAKPLYDPRLTRLVHLERTAAGMQLIWRGDKGGSREMLRVFKRGGILALLIDQDTRVPGTFAPFFGRYAHTPAAAAALALRTGAPISVGWIHRTETGFRLHFEEMEVEPPTEDRDADVQRLTARLNARLEAAIRQRPEQWVWLHDRWKTRPSGGQNQCLREAKNTNGAGGARSG